MATINSCYTAPTHRLILQEDINVEVDSNNILHINYEKKHEVKDEGTQGEWKYHRMERSETSQHRALKLPTDVDSGHISATCEDGVLCVNIPKMRPQTETRRRITVS